MDGEYIYYIRELTMLTMFFFVMGFFKGKHMFRVIKKEEVAQLRETLERFDRKARSLEFVGRNAFVNDNREYRGQTYALQYEVNECRVIELSDLNVNTSYILICTTMGVSLAPMSRKGLGKDANGFDSRMLRELKSKFIGRFFNLAIDYHAEKLGVTKDELTFVFIETNFFPTMCMLDQETYPHGIRAGDRDDLHRIPVHRVPFSLFGIDYRWGVWNMRDVEAFNKKRVKALSQLARDLNLTIMIRSKQVENIWKKKQPPGIEETDLVYFCEHPSSSASGAIISTNRESLTMQAFLDTFLDTRAVNFAGFLPVQHPENINRFPNLVDRGKLFERLDTFLVALVSLGYHRYQIDRTKDCLDSFLRNKPGAMVADDTGLGKSRVFFAVVAFLLVECDIANIVFVLFLCNLEELIAHLEKELQRFEESTELLRLNGNWSRAKSLAENRVIFDNHRTNKGFSDEAKRALHSANEVNTALIVDEALFCLNSATPLQRDIAQLPKRCFRNMYSATPIDGSLRSIFFAMKALNMKFDNAQIEATLLHVCEDILLREFTSSPAIDALRRVIASFTFKSSKAEVLASLPNCEGPNETYCFVEMSEESIEKIRGIVEDDDSDNDDNPKGIMRVNQMFGLEFSSTFPVYSEDVMEVCRQMHLLMVRDADAARKADAKKPTHLVIISSFDVPLGRKIHHDLIVLNDHDARTAALICHLTPLARRREIFKQLADANDPLRIVVTTGQTGGFGMNAPNIVSCDAMPSWTPVIQIQGEGRGQRHADVGVSAYERKIVSRTWIMCGPEGVASLSLTKFLRSLVRKRILQVLFPPATRDETAAFHRAALLFWKSFLRNDVKSEAIAKLHALFFADLGVNQNGVVELTGAEIYARLGVIGEQQSFKCAIPSSLYKLPNADEEVEELDERDNDDDDDDFIASDDDFIASDDEDEEDEDDGDSDNSDGDDDGDNIDDDDQNYTADAIMACSYFTSARQGRFLRKVRGRREEIPPWYQTIHRMQIDFANSVRGLTPKGEAMYSDNLMGRRERENTVSVVVKNVASFARGVIQTASGLYSGPLATQARRRSRDMNKSYGCTMQGAAIREFSRRMGIPPEDVVSMDDVTFFYRDGSGYPLLLVTLDFAIPRYDCIVEVKCKRHQHGMMRLDMQQEIRNHWGQCQAQMNIVGASKCVLLIYHNGDDPAGKYPPGYSRKMFEFAIIDRDKDFFRNHEEEWKTYRYLKCLEMVQTEPNPLSSFMDLVIPNSEVPEAFRDFVVAIVRASRNPIVSALSSSISRKRLREGDDLREGCEKIPEDEIIDWNGVAHLCRDTFPLVLQKLDRNTLKALHYAFGFKDDNVFPLHMINVVKENISQKFRLDDVKNLEMLEMAILWYEWPATNFEEEQKRFLRRVLAGERERGEFEFPMSRYLLTKALFRAYHEDDMEINGDEMDEED